MKIIELLNKIANGEEVPKKIEFCFRTFEYNGIDDYLCIDKNDYTKEDYCNGYSIHKWIFGNNLNDTVEILEEEKKIPEKLNLDTDELRGKETPRAIDYLIEGKINEVIDYLKSKGE